MLQIVSQMKVLKQEYLEPLETLFAQRAYTQLDPNGHKQEMSSTFHGACRQLIAVYGDISDQVRVATSFQGLLVIVRVYWLFLRGVCDT